MNVIKILFFYVFEAFEDTLIIKSSPSPTLRNVPAAFRIALF
jgi:hypothetical protein